MTKDTLCPSGDFPSVAVKTLNGETVVSTNLMAGVGWHGMAWIWTDHNKIASVSDDRTGCACLRGHHKCLHQALGASN